MNDGGGRSKSCFFLKSKIIFFPLAVFSVKLHNKHNVDTLYTSFLYADSLWVEPADGCVICESDNGIGRVGSRGSAESTGEG